MQEQLEPDPPRESSCIAAQEVPLTPAFLLLCLCQTPVGLPRPLGDTSSAQAQLPLLKRVQALAVELQPLAAAAALRGDARSPTGCSGTGGAPPSATQRGEVGLEEVNYRKLRIGAGHRINAVVTLGRGCLGAPTAQGGSVQLRHVLLVPLPVSRTGGLHHAAGGPSLAKLQREVTVRGDAGTERSAGGCRGFAAYALPRQRSFKLQELPGSPIPETTAPHPRF